MLKFWVEMLLTLRVTIFKFMLDRPLLGILEAQVLIIGFKQMLDLLQIQSHLIEQIIMIISQYVE
jgi:hypothetical protein